MGIQCDVYFIDQVEIFTKVQKVNWRFVDTIRIKDKLTQS